MKRIRIRNGRVVDPARGLDRRLDLCVAEGAIAAVGESPDFHADLAIDADGQVVCPGLIDLSAHLREPGEEHKATIASETRAAAAGGITTLCCPPDTRPVIDTPAVAEMIRMRAEQAGHAAVLPLGALTQGLQGERISEMAALGQAGCVGVSNALRPPANTLVQRRAFEYAATFDLPVFIHPRDPWLADRGCAHEGAVATRLGLPGIPEAAETIALARDLVLIEQTGARAHFTLLSTGRAVDMIAEARSRSLPVSADVPAHHLHLTELDIAGFDSRCHVQPPLRTDRDRARLASGLAAGILDALCSDHRPHERDAKLAPFCDTEPGISGLETLLPLGLRLVHDGLLPLTDLIARLTSGPARILGRPLGTLREGSAADICIFDPDRAWTLRSEQLRSRGRNTPFDGWEFRGRVTHTLFRGELVYRLDHD
jgi:dihydroorotase